MHSTDVYYQLCTRYSRCTMWQKLESVCTAQICTTSSVQDIQGVLCGRGWRAYALYRYVLPASQPTEKYYVTVVR